MPTINPRLATLLGGEFSIPQTGESRSLGQLMVDAFYDGEPGIVDETEALDARGIVTDMEVVRQESGLVPGVYVSAYTNTTGGRLELAGVQLEAEHEQTIRVIGGADRCSILSAYPGKVRGVVRTVLGWGTYELSGISDWLQLKASGMFQATHHRTHPS
jgi:hypothetical protein